jgi:SAM-dependent methyltransferase
LGVISETPSLEHLIESEDLGLEVLHPGGLALTSELARLCGADHKTQVLDIACGTGESACHIADEFGAQVVGIDASNQMLQRARSKTASKQQPAKWVRGDAHSLPFPAASFDIVICECTLCYLDKPKAVCEMLRVVRPTGTVGIHDLCWRADTPDILKRKLEDLEEESPETSEGWTNLMQGTGFVDIEVSDRSNLLSASVRETAARLGLRGHVHAALKVLRKWGLKGLRRVLASERLFKHPPPWLRRYLGTETYQRKRRVGPGSYPGDLPSCDDDSG